jgi:F-type H+-transporting ATPase subunit epsilon
MPKTIQLDIVTPEKVTFSAAVESVSLPGEMGELGVLPGHMPLVTVLKAGELRFTLAGEVQYLAVSGGYAEINPKKVVVLAETAEMAGEIDESRAQMDAQAKGQKLKGQKLSNEEMNRIRASMIKELVRMKVAMKRKKR